MTETSSSYAASLQRARDLQSRPFEDYSPPDYDAAMDLLASVRRRFRVRLGRRLRRARHGRLDFRRTLRAASQRGGTLIDLRYRWRRPRHVDLVILADVSGSVRYSTALMLALVAGVRDLLHRVHTFVYVDQIAEAAFEGGHLSTTPVLDFYARSDFGRVMGDFLREHSSLLNAATVLIILGDARNNRRPPRPDLLRQIARRSRAVIWLNPEPPARWGTGDSAIRIYERELDYLIPCGNLRELQHGLEKLAG